MWTIVIAMLVIVVLAGLVVLYVAFPHRGEDVPKASWLGDAMRKSVDVMPTLDNTEAETADPGPPAGQHHDDGSSPRAR